MQIIIAILFASALVWLIAYWKLFKNKRFSSTTFCGLFLLKLFFGLCFYLVYTAYYTDLQTSDMHKYYNDAIKIYELTKDNPRAYFSILTGLEINNNNETITQQLSSWYQEESASVINDSRMIIRFNLMMLPFSKGNIYLHLVIMVFLSFFGLYLIYVVFEKYFIGKEIYLLISCFGIPSVMFWSSGIMKEGLLIFFFGILVYTLIKAQKNLYLRVLILTGSMAGLFFSKFYVALSLIPSLIFLIISKIFIKISPLRQFILTCMIVVICAIAFNTIFNNLPLQKLSKKQNDFINLSIGGVYLANTNYPYDTIFTLKQSSLAAISQITEGKTAKLKPGTVYHHWTNPGYADTLVAINNQNLYLILKVLAPTGSAITLKRLMPSFKSVLQLFPEAFINVFFRPFIFDVENLFSLLAFIENLIFIILLIFLVFGFKQPELSKQRIVYFLMLFVFTLYTLVGLTTPVLGAAVRYKVPALPFLLMSVFLLTDFSLLKQRLNLLFKPLLKK